MQRLLFLVIGTVLRQVQTLVRFNVISPQKAASLIQKIGIPLIVERQRVVTRVRKDKNNQPYPNL